jgi:hypothetical protein
VAAVFFLRGPSETLINLATDWRQLIGPGAQLAVFDRTLGLTLWIVVGVTMLALRRSLGRLLFGGSPQIQIGETAQEGFGDSSHTIQLGLAAVIPFFLIEPFALAVDALNSSFASTRPLGTHMEFGRDPSQLLQIGGAGLTCLVILFLILERRRIAGWMVADQAVPEDTPLARCWLRFMAVINTAWCLPFLAASVFTFATEWQQEPPRVLTFASVLERVPVVALAAMLLGLAFSFRTFLAKDLGGYLKNLRPMTELEAAVEGEATTAEQFSPSADAAPATNPPAEGRDLAEIGFALLALYLGLR